MLPSDIDARVTAAIAIAKEAGALARRYFGDRDALAIDFKGPQDYITAADGEVERLIVGRIAERFPGDTCLGEEGGGTISPRLWVIDPIDGTANFAHGIPHFCISIAFVADGEMTIGVIHQPVNGELYVARRGGGATRDGKTLSVSKTPGFSSAVIELGWSQRRPNDAYLAMVRRVLDAGATFRRSGSGALGLAYVADGRQDGYCELHINSWDCLAGLLLVREAGGWINDFLAGEGMLKGNPVLACTPALRDALVAATGVGR